MADETSISARTIDALHAIAAAYTKAGNDIAAALRETGRADEAQIAAPVPAVRPQSGSGDSRTSGGLGERLRALAAGIETEGPVTAGILRGFADEADRLESDLNGLEQAKDQWRASASTAEAELREASRVIVRVQALAQWFRDQGLAGYARKVEEAVEGVGGASGGSGMNTQCVAKSQHVRIRGTDGFPTWSIRTTCDLPATHDGEHHFPAIVVDGSEYHVEA